jgi:DNA-binding MarR family transcriptional regulator
MDLAKRESLCREIVLLHDVWKDRNNFLAGRYEFTLVQGHLLVEVRAEPGISAVELTRRLMVSKSQVSRALDDLLKKGCIHEEACSSDGRVKRLHITEQGRIMIAPGDEVWEKFFAEHRRNLTDQEFERFSELFEKLADEIGAPYAAMASTDSKFRVQQRRITRASGLMTSNAHGTGTFNTLEWLLLYKAVVEEKPIIAADFTREYHLRANTLSDNIARLKQRKLIEVVPGTEGDKRKAPLQATQLGRTTLQGHLEAAQKLMLKATLRFSDEDLEAYWFLMHKFLHGSWPLAEKAVPLETVLVPEVKVRHICSSQELQTARSFHVRRLVEAKLSHLVAERLFASTSFSTVLERGTTILAVVEISHHNEEFIMTNFSVAEECNDRSLLELFITTSVNLFTRMQPTTKLRFDPRFPLLRHLKSTQPTANNASD